MACHMRQYLRSTSRHIVRATKSRWILQLYLSKGIMPRSRPSLEERQAALRRSLLQRRGTTEPSVVTLRASDADQLKGKTDQYMLAFLLEVVDEAAQREDLSAMSVPELLACAINPRWFSPEFSSAPPVREAMEQSLRPSWWTEDAPHVLREELASGVRVTVGDCMEALWIDFRNQMMVVADECGASGCDASKIRSRSIVSVPTDGPVIEVAMTDME